jgi:hypothetical protein
MRMVKAKDDQIMPLLSRLGEDLDRMRTEIRDLNRRVDRLELRYGVSLPSKD